MEDILSILKLKSVKKFKLPSFRKNIFYDIKFTDVIGRKKVRVLHNDWSDNKTKNISF